jgi:hypothetical protein
MPVGRVLEQLLAGPDAAGEPGRSSLDTLCAVYLRDDHRATAQRRALPGVHALSATFRRALVGRPLLRRYRAVQAALTCAYRAEVPPLLAALITAMHAGDESHIDETASRVSAQVKDIYRDLEVHVGLELYATPCDPEHTQDQWKSRGSAIVKLRHIPFVCYSLHDTAAVARAELWWLIQHDRPARRCRRCGEWFVVGGKTPWLLHYCRDHRDPTSRSRVLRRKLNIDTHVSDKAGKMTRRGDG